MASRKGALLAVNTWLLMQLFARLSTVAADVPGNPDMPTKPLWNNTWTDKLKADVLRNYDKFSRPTQHYNATVVIVGLTIRHVEIDEKRSTMTVHGWVKMFWDDEKLRWNESDYGNITILRVAGHEIWQPDIILYNSLTDIAEENYGHTNCVVYSSGSIVWVPPTKMVAICRLNLTYWPFDSQTCWVKLVSGSYNGDHIDLVVEKTGAEIELLAPNTEWQIENVTHHQQERNFGEDWIGGVVYYITMKRSSSTYTAVVVTPAIVIVLMTLSIFWLPPTSREKVFLSVCVAVITCLFLLSFAQRLPAMEADHSPLIVIFFSRSLLLVCLSLGISVAVLNLSRIEHLVPVPGRIKSCLAGTLGQWLGLGYGIVKVSPRGLGPTNHVSEPQNPAANRCFKSTQRDWVMLATVIDRIAFLVYCLLFTILAISYHV